MWQTTYDAILRTKWCTAVMREFVSDLPSAIDEGIAAELGLWLSDTNNGTPSMWGVSFPPYAQILADLADRNVIKSATELLEMGPTEFYAPNDERNNYAQSWLLAKAVFESSDPDVRSWFYDAIHRCGKSQSTKAAFLTTQPGDNLGREIQTILNTFSSQIPWWGGWRKSGDGGWHLSMQRDSASLLVFPKKIPAAAKCVAHVRLAMAIPNYHKVYFAFDLTERMSHQNLSIESYQCVFVDSKQSPGYARFTGEKWQQPASAIAKEKTLEGNCTELTLVLLPGDMMELTGSGGVTLLPRQRLQWSREGGEFRIGVFRSEGLPGDDVTSNIQFLECSVDIIE